MSSTAPPSGAGASGWSSSTGPPRSVRSEARVATDVRSRRHRPRDGGAGARLRVHREGTAVLEWRAGACCPARSRARHRPCPCRRRSPGPRPRRRRRRGPRRPRRRRAGWRCCRASPRTASRSGATSAPTTDRTGPSIRSVGRNFRVAAARSTMPLDLGLHVRAGVHGPQREDGPADVLDGPVELVDRPLEAGRRHRGRSATRAALSQAEPDREQPLDDQVVQVASDAVAVLQQVQPLLSPRGTGRSGGPAPPARRSSPAGPRPRRRSRPRALASRPGRAHLPRRCPTRAAPRPPGPRLGHPRLEDGSTARGSAARSRTGDRLAGVDHLRRQRMLHRQVAHGPDVGGDAGDNSQLQALAVGPDDDPRRRPRRQASRARSATSCSASRLSLAIGQERGDLRRRAQPELAPFGLLVETGVLDGDAGRGREGDHDRPRPRR